MKKALVWSASLLLTGNTVLSVTACSRSTLLIDIPNLKIDQLEDYTTDSLKKLSIDELFENFLKNKQIKKEQFAEVTKRLQLAVLKKEKDSDYFKKDYKQTMSALDSYIQHELIDKKWGTNWKREQKKAWKDWDGEEGFKDSLLLDTSVPVNVFNTFRSKFIESFQLDYNRYLPQDILAFANRLIEAMNKPDFDIDTWWNNDPNETQHRNRALRNGYGYANNTELVSNIKNDIDKKAIDDKKLIVFDDNGKPIISDSTFQKDKASVEQRYISEQWYNNLKPLHVSQITFKYDGKEQDGLNNGVDAKDFEEKGNKKKIEDFLKDASNKSFEVLANLFSNDNADSYGEIQSLLTINSSSSFSETFKAAAYDLAFDTSDGDALPTTFDDFLKLLNREGDKIVFKKLKMNNDKVVIFADNSEVRLVKINGYEKLKDGYNKTGDTGEQPTDDNTLPAITATTNMRLAKTPYLQYLFDEVKKRNQESKPTFNLLDEIKSYTEFSDSNIESNENWWFWFWEAMAWYHRSPDNKPKLDWYKSYISFEKPGWDDVLEQILTTYISSRGLTKMQTLIKQLNEENNKIKNLKDDKNAVTAQINVQALVDSFLNENNKLWVIEDNPTTPTSINTKNTNTKQYDRNWWLK